MKPNPQPKELTASPAAEGEEAASFAHIMGVLVALTFSEPCIKLLDGLREAHDMENEKRYQQGYDDCLREHGAVFKPSGAIVNGLTENPGICPVCSNPPTNRKWRLTNYNWRKHMKKHHDWRYDENDVLTPPGSQEGNEP